MSNTELKERYFDWLCTQVGDSYPHSGYPYQKLLRLLFTIEFTFLMPMDRDRYDDGVNLRFDFGYIISDSDNSRIRSEDAKTVMENLKDKPCSVLEMMVALAIKCEEIMSDDDLGDRVGQWFWDMIVNLGLDAMYDTNFNERYSRRIIDRFLHRRYEPDGKGGLFYIKNCYYNLKHEEIWYQLQWYLERYYDD